MSQNPLAADLFRPIFESTHGDDGFVSLEVSPKLARDTQGTIAEVRRFHRRVDRKNVMIKVPATPEGIPAIEQLIGEGIHINMAGGEEGAFKRLEPVLKTLAPEEGTPMSARAAPAMWIAQNGRY